MHIHTVQHYPQQKGPFDKCRIRHLPTTIYNRCIQKHLARILVCLQKQKYPCKVLLDTPIIDGPCKDIGVPAETKMVSVVIGCIKGKTSTVIQWVLSHPVAEENVRQTTPEVETIVSKTSAVCSLHNARTEFVLFSGWWISDCLIRLSQPFSFWNNLL